MSLNWDLTNVKDYKTICWQEDGTLYPRSHALIFMTMSVGIGHITEDNAGEFYARAKTIEGVLGATCYGPDPSIEIAQKLAADLGDLALVTPLENALRKLGFNNPHHPLRQEPIKMDDIIAHIGLSTNVAFESREQWALRMIVGKGDCLADYGDRLMTEDEREQQRVKTLQQADKLDDAGNWKAAEALRNKVESHSYSMLDTLVGNFDHNLKHQKEMA